MSRSLAPDYNPERGRKSIANRKTTTSSEVKNRWNAKTYKRYQVSLRKEDDADLIEFVESVKDRIGISEIFRAGVEQIKKEGRF